jgi:hypothetical protein
MKDEWKCLSSGRLQACKDSGSTRIANLREFGVNRRDAETQRRKKGFSLCSAIPQNRATLAKSLAQMPNAIWPSSILYFPSSFGCGFAALRLCASAVKRF